MAYAKCNGHLTKDLDPREQDVTHCLTLTIRVFTTNKIITESLKYKPGIWHLIYSTMNKHLKVLI